MGDPAPDMQEWVGQVAGRLGLDLAGVDQQELVTAVLDLTADVAHGVSRPAAPVTAFLVGLAAGGAADPPAAVARHIAAVRDLAALWSPSCGPRPAFAVRRPDGARPVFARALPCRNVELAVLNRRTHRAEMSNSR